MQFKVTPTELSTRMLFTTARITADLIDGSVSYGTGFYFNSGNGEYLLTNKHVIEDAITVSFPVHTATQDQDRPQFVNLGKHRSYMLKPEDWYHHPDPEIDLCCVPTSRVFQEVKKNDYFYLSISN